MSNELTDVRCPCGAEFQADSYDAGFIAGSGMCQNCDAAMPPKDIPAPVEQAGGDERAAFFKHLIGRHPAHETEIVRVVEHNYAAWKAWQARAALAQPSPMRCLACGGYHGNSGLPCPNMRVTAQAQPSPAGVQLSASRERRIYIAGPMTGYKDCNFPAFNAQAEALRGLGYHVENPADHGVVDGAEWRDYLRYDISRLSTCEAIFLLPGWSKSKGAALEVYIAKALGMTFIHHADAEREQPSPTLPPFAEKVLAKLRRFNECAEDSDSGGVDIGRHWLDLLTQLGLLNRVQRSPALWEISQQGEDLLGLDVPEIEVPDSMIEKAWQRFERTLQQLETPGQAEQAEQAEAERPEVVAWQYRVTAGPQTGWSLWHPGKGEEFERSYTVERRPLMTVAQHDRIVGELRAVIAQLRQHKNDYMDAGQETYRALQNEIREREAEIARLDGLVSGHTAERDAALARVAELERQEPVGWEWIEVFVGGNFDGEEADNGFYRGTDKENILPSIEGTEVRQRPLYAAPVAQTQHSVPEGWVQSLPLKNHQPCKPNEDRANGYTIPIYSRPALVEEALRKLRAVLCDPIGNVVIDGSDSDREEVQQALGMLAAAPGKEGV